VASFIFYDSDIHRYPGGAVTVAPYIVVRFTGSELTDRIYLTQAVNYNGQFLFHCHSQLFSVCGSIGDILSWPHLIQMTISIADLETERVYVTDGLQDAPAGTAPQAIPSP
jgi:hypothetical protein